MSCQKENNQSSHGNKNNKEIKIKEGLIEEVTKGSRPSDSEEVLFSLPFVTERGDTLCLVASISDMTESFVPQAVTKASTITTESLKTKYGSFKTSVFKEDGTSYTDGTGKSMSAVVSSWSSSDGWNLVGAPYYWPEGNEDIIFCSSAPDTEDSGISGLSWYGGTKVSFNYANKPLGQSATDQAFHDAENQKDILFAINKQNSGTHGGEAHINFSHALVGVRFIKGDIQDCELQKVSLRQFNSEGTAVGTPKSETSLGFEWSGQSSLQDYEQTFTGAKKVNELADKASLDPTTDQSYTFLMIPQTLDSEAAVELYLHYGGASYQCVSVKLGSITAELAGSEENASRLKDWSSYAGKIITIRVNRADIAVSVDEDFVDGATVKENVGARNTGGKVEYVRASIVANWVDEEGNICEECDFTGAGVGVLEGYLASGCNWYYNTADEFYYYKKAIVPGAVTAGKIFTSYAVPAAPEEGLHLEMSVIVQGVEYDSNSETPSAKAKAAWGIGDILTNDIETTN